MRKNRKINDVWTLSSDGKSATAKGDLTRNKKDSVRTFTVTAKDFPDVKAKRTMKMTYDKKTNITTMTMA